MYPPSQSVKVTQSVKFTTTVSGVGKENFSYQWRHNGEYVKGETSNTYIFTGGFKDSGKYDCVVENTYGNIATSEAVELSKLMC